MIIEHAPIPISKDWHENLKQREWYIKRGYEDPEFAHKLWVMCKRNPLFFVNTFCFIPEVRTSRVLPFITHPTQDRVLLALEGAVGKHGVVVPKGRDEGISTTGMAFTLWRSLFYDMQTILLVSNKQELVYDRGNMDALMSKIDFMEKRLPTWLRDPDWVYTELHMASPLTGSTIDGVSSEAHTGTGRRKTFIWFDEFAKVTNAATIFADTATVSNSRFFCSTHVGRGTKFYELSNDDHFQQVRVHWTDNPIHAKDKYRAEPEWGYEWRSPWSDQTFLDMGRNKATYAQEVEIDPIQSDTNFFEPTLVEECLKKCEKPTHKGNLVDRAGRPLWEDAEDGKFELWIDPRHGIAKWEQFAAGADIAAGSGATPSCLSIISCMTGKKVAAFASAGMADYRFAELCLRACRWFNDAYFVWERSGMAMGFTRVIVESGYSNIWWKKSNEKSVKGKLSDTPGWQPTVQGKVDAGMAYAAALAQGRMFNPSREAILELNSFVLTVNSSMQHRPSADAENVADARENHGDRVIADMLAWMAASEKMQGVQPKPLSMIQQMDLQLAGMFGKMDNGTADDGFNTGAERAGSFE